MEEMGKPLLLLHQRYTADDQAVWREAIRRGWQGERIGTARVDIERKILGYKHVRYYGNVLHQSEAAPHLPIRFPAIDPKNLTQLQEFTKRKIELMPARWIGQPLTERAFYKCPGVKYIESRIYNAGESFNCLSEDLIYRQEPIDIVSEIRCFVVNGEILTASWYVKDKKFSPIAFDTNKSIDNLTLLFMSDMAKRIWQVANWPRGVVFDFGLLGNGNICLIEVNEAWASGLYECSSEGVFDTIIASQN